MTKHLLPIFLLLAPFPSLAQGAKEMLRLSQVKCSSVQNGVYHHSHSLMSFQTNDTVRDAYQMIFKRSPGDTVFDWRFHSKFNWQEKYTGEMLYTGSVWAIFNDTIGETISKERYGEHIKQTYTGPVIYPPFEERRSNPFPAAGVYTDTINIFKDLGIEKASEYTCYHIRLTEPGEVSLSDTERRIKRVRDFWINVSDSILVTYTSFEQVLYGKDTAWWFTKDILDAYELNALKDESALSSSSIPSTCRLTEYTPRKPLVLLPAGALAPGWTSTSINDEKISLGDLKGRLVLMDFFYEGCFPCVKALPALRRLNEKYWDRGLRVIGFDPWDKKGEGLIKFLKDRQISYPIVLDCAAVNNDYHVSFYPTVYLIGKDGKILYSGSGYTDEDDKKMEELIKKHL